MILEVEWGEFLPTSVSILLHILVSDGDAAYIKIKVQPTSWYLLPSPHGMQWENKGIAEQMEN